MIVKINSVKEQKNGSTIVDLDYTKEFTEMVKTYYNKKRCTKKMIQSFIIEGLENYIKKGNK